MTPARATLVRVETSCPCVSVSPLPASADPGMERTLTIALDLKDEPEFRGGLSVELTGRDPAGVALFRARVECDVRDEVTSFNPTVEVIR